MLRSAQPLPLRGTDKGRRALETEKAELPLEHIGHILAAMIVTDGKATSDAPGEGTETVRTPLSESNPDRLQRLEPGAMAGSMDTHTLGTVMVDGNEHSGLAFTRPGRGHVRAPHDIHGIGPGHLNQPWCHRGCVVHLVFLPGRVRAGRRMGIAGLGRGGGTCLPGGDQALLCHRTAVGHGRDTCLICRMDSGNLVMVRTKKQAPDQTISWYIRFIRARIAIGCEP